MLLSFPALCNTSTSRASNNRMRWDPPTADLPDGVHTSAAWPDRYLCSGPPTHWQALLARLLCYLASADASAARACMQTGNSPSPRTYLMERIAETAERCSRLPGACPSRHEPGPVSVSVPFPGPKSSHPAVGRAAFLLCCRRCRCSALLWLAGVVTDAGGR